VGWFRSSDIGYPSALRDQNSLTSTSSPASMPMTFSGMTTVPAAFTSVLMSPDAAEHRYRVQSVRPPLERDAYMVLPSRRGRNAPAQAWPSPCAGRRCFERRVRHRAGEPEKHGPHELVEADGHGAWVSRQAEDRHRPRRTPRPSPGR